MKACLCIFFIITFLALVRAEDEIFLENDKINEEEPKPLRAIKTISSCVAQLDDGRLIDLTSLNNVTRPRTVNATDFIYQFNPCDPISCGSADNSAICQSLSSSINFNLGDQKSASFAIDPAGVVSINFKAGDRTSNLQCICGQVESFQFVKEEPLKNYNLIFISPCCCPNGCNSTTSSITTLSSCTARLNNGRMIDLSSLDNPSSPRVSKASKYTYSFNPCSPIQCDSGQKDTAVCQQDVLLKQFYTLGTQTSVKFSLDKDNVVSLNLKTSAKTTVIQCLCGQVESYQFVRESPLNNYFFIFISPCCCPDGCASQSIVTLSPCKAKLTGEGIINLTPLSRPVNPRTIKTDLYTYTWNPCDPIPCIPNSSDTSSCQTDESGGVPYELGIQQTAKFLLKDGTPTIYYTSSIDPFFTRTTYLKCICAQNESFKFVNENPKTVYNFEFSSKCCCPNGCP